MKATARNEDILKNIHPGMVVEAYCARNADPLEGVIRDPQSIDRIDTTPEDIPFAQAIQTQTVTSTATADPLAPQQSSNTGVPSPSESEQLIIAECQRQGITDPNQIAYILGTAKHESDHFNTLTEYADGSAYEYRSDLGNNNPGDGVTYKGRGYVQITGRTNYEKYSQITGRDLIGNPDQVAQDPALAAFILVHGMKNGSFTGVGLDDYFTPGNPDFYNARRIVNGTDRADLIASYAQEYLNNLPEFAGQVIDNTIPTSTATPSAVSQSVITPSTQNVIGPEVEPVEDYYLDKCPHLLMVGIVTDYGRSIDSWGLTLTISGESFGKIYKDAYVLADLQSPELASVSLEVRNSTLLPLGVSFIYYRILKEWVEAFWGNKTGWEARTRPIPFPPNYITRINSEGSAWSALQWLAIPGFFHIFVDHTGAIVWEKLPWSASDQSLISGRNWEDLQLLDMPSWKIISWGDRLSGQGIQNFIRCVPTNQGQSGGQDPVALPGLIYNIGSIRQYGGPVKRELTFPTGTAADQYYTSDPRREQQATINSFTSLTALECIRWYDRPTQRLSTTARGESAWRIHTRISIRENWANPDVEPGEYYVVARSHQIQIDQGAWRTQLDLVRDRRNRYLGIGIGEVPIITESVVDALRNGRSASEFTEAESFSVATDTALTELENPVSLNLAGDLAVSEIDLGFDEPEPDPVEFLSSSDVDLSGARADAADPARFTETSDFSFADVQFSGELPPPNELARIATAEGGVDINVPLVPDEYYFFDRLQGKIVPIGNDPIAWARAEVIPKLGEESVQIFPDPVSATSPALPGTAAPPGDTNAAIINATNNYRGADTSAGPDGGRNACVWAVNNILADAGITPPWGDSLYVPTVLDVLNNGGGTPVSAADSQPGDIVIWGDGHIGIVTAPGATSVISNSSSNAAFVWDDSNANVEAYYGAGSQIFRL